MDYLWEKSPFNPSWNNSFDEKILIHYRRHQTLSPDLKFDSEKKNVCRVGFAVVHNHRPTIKLFIQKVDWGRIKGA